MSTYTRFLHRATGPEKVLQILLRNQAAFTASGTDYWTFVIRKVSVKPDGSTRQSYGTQIGDIYSLATRSLEAGVPVTIYDDERGTTLKENDELWATEESTGSPAALTRATYEIQFQRIVR